MKYVRSIGHALSARHHHEGWLKMTQGAKRILPAPVFRALHLPLQQAERLMKRVSVGRKLSERLAKGKTDGARTMLIIDHFPMADRHSGAVRLRRLISILREDGWNIVFIPFDLHYQQGYAEDLHHEGVAVLCHPVIRSVKQHLRACGDVYDCVLLCRAPIADDYIEDVRQYATHARIVFDTVDLHFLRQKRHAEVLGDDGIRRQSAALKEKEIRLVLSADCTIVVSEEERTILQSAVPDATIRILSNIHTIHPPTQSDADRHAILFIGFFGHAPNVDAARWLAEDIWPRVSPLLPEAELLIVGDDPHGKIDDLQGERLRITGHVSELEPVLNGVRLSVAPLRFGAGVKGKLTMSLSRGIPIVTTRIGAEGMDLKNGMHALIRDDAASFADAVVRLFQDARLREGMSHAGLNLARRRFSVEAARTSWRDIESALGLFPPRIHAVIPTALHDEAMLIRCLDALYESSGIDVRATVVLCPASAERREAAQRIVSIYPAATLIPLDPPFSFARSNNIGLENIGDAQYVLFLNDDCFFRTATDVPRLIRTLRAGGLACVGPWMEHARYTHELPKERRTHGPVRTRYPVIGACMLWDRTWLDRVGRFDESFSGYGMEEADLLYRALQLHGRWMRDDAVVVDHVHHATVGPDIKEDARHRHNLSCWTKKYPGVHSWGMSREWERNLSSAASHR